MNPTKIDWPGLTHTWNPVTGCKRGCKWGNGGCYAKRNWNRLHRKRERCEFETIKFYPGRLLKKPPKATTCVFVGSMTDIEYWQQRDIAAIINYCRKYPEIIFMFLSKNPLSYSGFHWPVNTRQGLTMDLTQTQKWQEIYLERIRIAEHLNPFLSLEPLLGNLLVPIPMEIDLVIVGAMTGIGAIAPQPEWIDSIKANVPNEKIYWKSSMKEYLK